MATTIHARLVGDATLLPRSEFERLVALAQQNEEVSVELQTDDVPTPGIMQLAEQGGAFDWLADEEDIYTVNDLKVRYR